MRLAVRLNPLAAFNNLNPYETSNLLNAAVALDLAGVDGIVCRVQTGSGNILPKDLPLLKAGINTHLTVESELDDSFIPTLLELKPDQVTLIPTGLESNRNLGFETGSFNGIFSETVNSLHASGIDVGVLVRPDITAIKEVRRTNVDFVTLNINEFSNCKSTGDAISLLEEIESAALGANHLDLGVGVSGSIDHRNVSAIAALGTIDDLTLGHRFFSRSLHKGFEGTISEIKSVIHSYENRG
jgi:pyridoxine 5'-phosphate synthase PdxJ